MPDLMAAIMVDTTAVTTTAWGTTAAITVEQPTIGAAITTRGTGTVAITAIAITADTAITTRTIGASGMAAGTATASARAGAGRRVTTSTSGFAVEQLRYFNAETPSKAAAPKSAVFLLLACRYFGAYG